MSDAHANAVKILRAAKTRRCGLRCWEVGNITLALSYSPLATTAGDGRRWGMCWWFGIQRLYREAARLVLRGLLAQTPEELAADETVFFAAGFHQGREEVWARYKQYFDGIGSALVGYRLLRDTGEPALSDGAEIERLVQTNAKLQEQLQELANWCFDESGKDGGREAILHDMLARLRKGVKS